MTSSLNRRTVAWGVTLALLLAAGAASAQQLGGPKLGGTIAEGLLDADDPLLSPGRLTVSAKVTPLGSDPAQGTLVVTALVPPGYHIYSITQQPGGPKTTTIALAPSQQFELRGKFAAQEPPQTERYPDIWPGLAVEEHHGAVTWTAPLAIKDAKAGPVTIRGEVKGQICTKASCQNIKDATFEATYQYTPPQDLGVFRAPTGHVTILGSVNRQAIAPGDTAQVTLTIQPADGWHAYALEDPSTRKSSLPTLLVLTGAARGAKPQTTAPQKTNEEGVQYYDGPVTFTFDVTAPSDAQESLLVSGQLGYQVCAKSCDPPAGLEFSASIPVQAQSVAGQTPLVFAKTSYSKVVEAAKAAAQAAGASRARAPIDFRKLALVLLASFAGGAILNLMPCVLPVLGLKIMGFVQQAHHDRRTILKLNVWFTAGLIAVFLALATFAVVVGASWGEQFTSTWFNLVLASVVFVMALSFLGVWEIPIPGFVGTGAAQDLTRKEGAAGAFSKGVITTVLATPCSGPLLGSVFAYTVTQPPVVVYMIFSAIGLGMASPYLAIGAFPALMRYLPKPGAWMDTFKHIMGFVLLGTVVFVFSFLDRAYVVPAFGLLVALWFCCWWIGQTPYTAPAAARLRAWAIGGATAAVFGWLAFALFGPIKHVVDWKPFSTLAAIEHEVAQGNTVLVDFTADW